jgi:protocatechuate 3,4-dioxygenase beta subunit
MRSEIDLGDFTIAAEAIVAGSVVDETGRPLAGSVTVRRTIVGAPISVEPAQPLSVPVDEAGRFRVSGLAAGTYRLRFRGAGATSDDAAPLDEMVTVRDGEAKDGIRFVSVGMRSITGFVVDADSEPVVGAIVSFRSTVSFGDVPKDAFSGGTGSFSSKGLRPGTYEISVSPRSALNSMSSNTTRLKHLRIAVVEAGAQDVRIAIPRSRPVSGIVLEATGVASCRPLVEVLAADGTRMSATAGGWDGTFALDAPEGVSFTLKATAPTTEAIIDGRPDFVYDVFVAKTGVAAGTADVVLKLPPR